MGRTWAASCAAVLALALWPASAAAAGFRDSDVYARVTPARVVLGNSVAERSWARDSMRTLQLVDKRGGSRVWSREGADFSLSLGGVPLPSTAFSIYSLPNSFAGLIPLAAQSRNLFGTDA